MVPQDLDLALEVVLGVPMDIGEGPIWDAVSRTLLLVDSTLGRIYRLDPASRRVSHRDVGQQIGVAIPRRRGGLVASSQAGLLAVDEAGGTVDVIVPVEPDRPHNRMNDARCDSRGRLWSGTFSLKFERAAGTLYRIDPDLGLTAVQPGISISNGIAWSPDETTMYYVDTGARRIDAFDYDIPTGGARNRRAFVKFGREEGLPDGLAVDAEGHLWVALYYGGVVRRYSPAGEWVGTITLPVARVTSCGFGGPDLGDLYTTTATHLVEDDGRPHEAEAGFLFCCRPGVPGLQSHPFAG